MGGKDQEDKKRAKTIVYVRGTEGSNISRFLEKVVFHLHNTFANPRRDACTGPLDKPSLQRQRKTKKAQKDGNKIVKDGKKTRSRLTKKKLRSRLIKKMSRMKNQSESIGSDSVMDLDISPTSSTSKTSNQIYSRSALQKLMDELKDDSSDDEDDFVDIYDALMHLF
ncbi:hypothetical protein CHS0354_026442 [Potamilus streckersoni]|uniref:YEATS domain-containing protein n=1 Tax=Potamilus streckersoni TaxID=2493646 RepID=A0AAE0RQ73_9BIVA|nr:hypothetical protein CHS0354_026442 [Potamilus streckersoni]